MTLLLDTHVAVEAVRLPGDLHRDPADRLIVATARLTRSRLVSRDARLIAYAKQGHVAVMAV